MDDTTTVEERQLLIESIIDDIMDLKSEQDINPAYAAVSILDMT